MKKMRKPLILLLFFFACSNLFAQRDKPKTYAMVIGISDYEVDSLDLQFAHRDAQIFYDYLRSPAGGEIPDTSINLLIDEDATYVNIHEGFKDLIYRAKKKDRVIIYFSGHGDVESDQFSPLGYFLAVNTLTANYRTNGVRVRDFNDYATTLTLDNQAQVVFYIDACRAGELAGASNEGPELAAREARKRQRNVVKIMSCQPEERSLEVEELDGGRGLFSHFLIKGLIGEADKGGDTKDYKITIDELGDYIFENVKTAAYDEYNQHYQHPEVTGGQPGFEIAKVEDEVYTAFQSNSIAAFSSVPMPSFSGDNSDIASNSDIDDIDTDAADTDTDEVIVGAFVVGGGNMNDPQVNSTRGRGIGLRVIHPPFDNAIEQSKFLAPEDSSAVSIYERLKKENPGDSRLRAMKSRLVVALQDAPQKGINAYLKSDQKELDRRFYIAQSTEYEQYPARLAKAAELVGPEDKTYRSLKVKQKYYEGVNLRLEISKTAQTTEEYTERIKEAMAIQQEALTWDDSVSYIYNEIGLLHLQSNNLNEAETVFNKAIMFTPRWALPYANLAGLHTSRASEKAAKGGDNSRELKTAENLASKAITLNPNYMNGYIHMGIIKELSFDLLNAEHYYRKAIRTNWQNFRGFENLAYNYTLFGDYKLADHLFKEADLRKEGIIPNLIVSAYHDDALAIASGTTAGPGYTEAELLDMIRKNPKDHKAWGMLADLYVYEDRKEEAENCYLRVIEIKNDRYDAYQSLGYLYKSWNRYEDAIAIWYRPIELLGNFESSTAYYCAQSIWRLYEEMERNEESEALITRYVNEDYEERNDELYSFYTRMVGKYAYNPVYWYKRALLLYDVKEDGFHWHATSTYPDDSYTVEINGEQKQVKLNTPWLNFWGLQVISDLEKVLKLDRQHPSLPDIHLKLGELHAMWGDLYKGEVFTEDRMYYERVQRDNQQLDLYNSFLDLYETAIQHSERSHRLTPEMLGPIHQLINQYTTVFEHDKALELLEQLNDSLQLDTRRRQLLVRNYMLRGDLDKAEPLLDFGVKKPIGADKEDLLLESLFLRLKKDYKEAIKSLEYVMKFDPKNADLQYRYATLHVLKGNDRQAIKWLGKAFKNGFNYKKIVKYDPDLESIRDLKKYNKLLIKYNMI